MTFGWDSHAEGSQWVFGCKPGPNTMGILGRLLTIYLVVGRQLIYQN